jgi:hypothetical protein
MKLSLYRILVVIALFVVIFYANVLFSWPLGDAALRMNYENVWRPNFLSSFKACGRVLSEDPANRFSLSELEFATTIQHHGRSWIILYNGFSEIQEDLISKARLVFFHVVLPSSE